MARKNLSAYRLRKWSVLVRWRDRRCQICGSRDRLQAHHINSVHYHPEQAYYLRNGITLCSSSKRGGNRCHIVYHTYWHRSFRHKATREEWHRFVRLVRWAMNITVQSQL